MFDKNALLQASKGVDAIYLMLPLVYEGDIIFSYFHNVIQAAVDANVGLIVFNPSTRVPEMRTTVWGFEIKREMERRLKESGIPFIIIRPTFYMENLMGPWTLGWHSTGGHYQIFNPGNPQNVMDLCS